MFRFALGFGLLFIAVGWLFSQQNIALLQPSTPVPASVASWMRSNSPLTEFKLVRGMIWVEGVREGQNGHYLLDTGAPGLVINSFPANENQQYNARSFASHVDIGSLEVPTFTWAGGTFQNVNALTLDLGHLETASRQKLEGILGYDLFQEGVLFIDYQRQRIGLLNPEKQAISQMGTPVLRLNFELDGHLPIVTMTDKYGGVVRFCIDTGAASNIMDADVWERLNCTREITGEEEIQGLDQHIHTVQVGEASGIQLGNMTFSSHFLLTRLDEALTESGQPIHGILGYEFLKNYKVAIHYPAKQLVLWAL